MSLASFLFICADEPAAHKQNYFSKTLLAAHDSLAVKL